MNKIWRGKRPDGPLAAIGLTTALIMSIPILYVGWRALFAGTERWVKLLDTRIPKLLWNTLSLTVLVTVCAVVIGVACAWFVNRTDLPGRKLWQWLLALPLVIPPYVGAMAYVIIFGPRGSIRDIWASFPVNMYSFWGIAFILTMFTYPYVYLITSASLQKMNRSYEDVARSHGMGTWYIFWRINLPFLQRAIGAGMILVSLYVLSDFGAVAMLRYTTFTAAIYHHMDGHDNISAAVLSLVLIVITLMILQMEAAATRKQKVYQTSNTYKAPDTIRLHKWKAPVFIFICAVFIFSVLLPLAVLIYWAWIGVANGALSGLFWSHAIKSLLVAGGAALLSIILALPIIYLKHRHPSALSTIIEKLSYAGYALPGVIVALGIIFMATQYVPLLYNTAFLISIAYVIRFLPQAMQSGEASLALISPTIDEAARSLGYPPWKVLFKVIIPLVLPGLLAGGALVFVSSIKELPATLLLRPPGFDTLSVRVWVEASESLYHLAAPAALFIIIVSLIPLRLLLKRY